MSKMQVPFVDLSRFFNKHKQNILKLTDTVGKSGIYILGEIVEKFEKDFAEFCGVKYAISVGNGTDALALSLKSLDISKGDEVIIPGNSFIATAGAVIEVGATPICVDVKKDQNICINSINGSISPKTKAIIVVHLNGKPVQIEEIKKAISGTDIKIIEDAAQSIGAELNGQKTGSLGVCGCFSLHPLKNFHLIGDAGMITTNSAKLAKKLKILRNHGLIDRDKCQYFSRNSRLDTLQASFGSYLLPHLDAWTDRVIKIAEYYQNYLNGKLFLPNADVNSKHVFHNFVVQTPFRNELSNYLKFNGVETKIHYPIPICEQPAWKNLSLPQAIIPRVKKQKDMILSLPIYAELTDLEVEYVAKSVDSFFSTNKSFRDAV